jgi:hypothetical protein
MSSLRPRRSFLDAAQHGVLTVDGAMGTQLYERGVLFSACFEELNVTRPELVAKVHEDYVRAGAQVIETNTFGANALRLEKYGLSSRVKEINEAGVRIARAAAGTQAYVVGAIGPSGYFLGEASTREAVARPREGEGGLLDQARRSSKPGSMRSRRDATPDARAARRGRSRRDRRRRADAGHRQRVARRERPYGRRDPCRRDRSPHARVGRERRRRQLLGRADEPCSRRSRRWSRRVADLRGAERGPPPPRRRADGLRVDAGVLRRVRARMFRLGVRLVGGCCGTTPEHIKRIAASARMAAGDLADVGAERNGRGVVRRAGRRGRRSRARRIGRQPVPFEQKSELAAKLARRQVRRLGRGEPAGRARSVARRGGREDAEGGRRRRRQHRRRRARAGAHEQPRARGSARARGAASRRSSTCAAATGTCSRRSRTCSARTTSGSGTSSSSRAIRRRWATSPTRRAVYDLDSIGILKLASRSTTASTRRQAARRGTSFLLATGPSRRRSTTRARSRASARRRPRAPSS